MKDYTPHGYQKIITDAQVDLPRCAAWAFMGSGKTSATLTALDMMFLAGEDKPALVLAPLRVARSTWGDETAKWNHLRSVQVHPIVGEAFQRREQLRRALDRGNASVFTCNYENLPWLEATLTEWGREWPFDKVVLDESTRIKSFRGSYRVSTTGKEFFQGAGGVRARVLGPIMHEKVRRVIELSGTPSPNGLEDLWGQLWMLDRGHRLGRTFDAFTSRWFQRTRDGYGVVPLPHAQAEITERVKDICISVKAEDWFDLEQPREHNVYVDLPPKARSVYRDMEKKMFAEINDNPVEAFNAASKSIKCLQLASGACIIDDKGTWSEVHDEKIEALKDVIEEACGAPVMVAYHFKSDLARLKKAFPYARHIDKKKDEDDFKAGKIRVALVHPASIGHGVDGFQRVCNIIAFFSHWWAAEERQQIIERIGPVRQMQAGFNRLVYVYNIVARNTVDEDVLEAQASKRSVQEVLMDAARRRA